MITTSSNINNINIYLFEESHKNHLGSTDNFIQTQINGNGAVSSNTTTHEMNLSTGITNSGYAIYETKTNIIPISSKIICASFIINNIVNGNNVTRETFIGFSSDFSTNSIGAYYYQDTYGNWKIRTKVENFSISESILPINNNDKLSIIISHNEFISFYVNSIKQYEYEYSYNTGLKAGVSVITTSGSTSARSISIKMINEIIYRG